MRRWGIFLAAFLAIALTTSLGVWQLRRATQKEALAAQVLKQNQQTPLENAGFASLNLTDNQDWLQRPVRLQGRWLHEQTVFLDNRLMQVRGQWRTGFYVATPLLLEGGKAIWVQRGWVARDFQDRARLPVIAQPGGTVTVTVPGRLTAHVSRAYAFDEESERGGKSEETSQKISQKTSQKNLQPVAGSPRIWQNLPLLLEKDLGAPLLPAALLQTAPEAVSLNVPSSPSLAESGDLLRDWPAPDTGVAKHHGYAFQWFALSALLFILYVWFQIVVPRRKQIQPR